ncbi:MAG: hypothetical protein IJR14_07855, partial [Synergistaceae bacterium]|nr:hypothetical protein [Synergistaceae bacterium]
LCASALVVLATGCSSGTGQAREEEGRAARHVPSTSFRRMCLMRPEPIAGPGSSYHIGGSGAKGSSPLPYNGAEASPS